MTVYPEIQEDREIAGLLADPSMMPVHGCCMSCRVVVVGAQPMLWPTRWLLKCGFVHVRVCLCVCACVCVCMCQVGYLVPHLADCVLRPLARP